MTRSGREQPEVDDGLCGVAAIDRDSAEDGAGALALRRQRGRPGLCQASHGLSEPDCRWTPRQCVTVTGLDAELLS